MMPCRSCLFGVLLLGLGAAGASAQVAAPRLTPIGGGIPSMYGIFYSALDIVNPAVQAWAESSYIGAAGTVDGGLTRTNPDGSVLARGEQKGELAQLRLVGEFVALAALRSKMRVGFKDVGGPVDQGFETVDIRVELAVRYADWWALGVARQDVSARFRFEPPADDDMRRRKLDLPGISLRFWDFFYLGYASATERVGIESAAVVPGIVGASEEDRRRVTRAGVGLRRRGGDWGFHLEGYREEREPFRLPTAFPGFEFDKSTLSGATLELIVWDLLLGYERIETDVTRLILGVDNGYVSEGQRLSVGWVPRQGFTVIVTGQTGRGGPPPPDTEFDAVWAAIGWQF